MTTVSMKSTEGHHNGSLLVSVKDTQICSVISAGYTNAWCLMATFPNKPQHKGQQNLKLLTKWIQDTFIPASLFGHADAFSPIMHLSRFTAAVWYKGFICGKMCVILLTMFASKELKMWMWMFCEWYEIIQKLIYSVKVPILQCMSCGMFGSQTRLFPHV